jgi:hypothetical protein
MTHLPYILAAYSIMVLVSVGFAADAWRRSVKARRRLLAIDPRAQR